MTSVRSNVMEKRLGLARELACKNGGKLPNPWKMIQQGHGGLYRYIQRHPKEFKKFKIEEVVTKNKNGSSGFNISIREEHLKTARQLAQKNSGVLKYGGCSGQRWRDWLMQHGYTRLASYIKTYPHVFDNI